LPAWTDDQRTAFTYHGGQLLVSAAAGSGKTAVLVQRILSRLTDESVPEEIGRFLVVTFTNAAAADMKDKIRDEISRRLAADPKDRRLARQLAMLPQASIGTVHSFCFRLIRENFQTLGLPANLRIGGEAECAALAEKAMEETLEAAFAEGSPAFLAFADQLSDTRDNGGIEELILSCYRDLMAAPDPEGTVRRALEQYGIGAACVEQSLWGREVLRNLVAAAEDSALAYAGAIRSVEASDGFDKYLPLLQDERAMVENVAKAAALGWDAARDALAALEFIRLPSVRGDAGEKELVKRVRENAKNLKDFLSKQLSEDEKTVRGSISDQRPVAEGLLSVTLAYARRFREKKLEKNIVDFTDVEQEACRLLVERIDVETGEVTPTEAALDIGRRYAEIMVDEYQDTNPLQDAIFSALSSERKNLFMVGDVKQSIYRFRQADPTVFLEKYRAFAPVSAPDDCGERRQSLSCNFRSRAEVLNSVNAVFEKICIPAFSEISYGSEERLYCGRPDVADDRFRSELHMVDTESDDGEWSEPRAIARRITQLLEEKLPIKRKDGSISFLAPGDIVILLRADGGRAALIAAELHAAGIPCRVEQDNGFCETLEVRTALGCLEALHNPMEDIALLSYLRCPGIAMTAEKLAYIRSKRKKGPFYDALCLAAREDKECASALETLRGLRRESRELSPSRILRRIYDVLSLANGFRTMSGGEMRHENLMTLWGHARVFETDGEGGVHEFCEYMHLMKEHAEKREPQTGGNAVSIMTIHRSKGLEFPVVVLAAAGKAFNEDSRKSPVLRHRELGIGARRKDIRRRLTFSTLPRDAIELRTQREDRAEELRVLYVAMTRPREKLIIFTSPPHTTKPFKWMERLRLDYAAAGISAYRLSQAAGAGDWLWSAVLAESDGGLADFGSRVTETVSGHFRLVWNTCGENAVTEHPEIAEDSESPGVFTVSADELRRRAFSAYAHPAAVTAPGKVTVTELKGREKDTELDSPIERTDALGCPAFLKHSREISGAERGTAVHMLLSRLDFARTDETDIREAIKKLVAGAFIEAAAAETIEAVRIADFFASELGKRIRSAPEVLREFKFSVLVPAESVFDMGGETGEHILMQGVADAVIRTDNELIVIDYKTDRPFGSTDLAAWLRDKTEVYRRQVELYADALARIFGLPVRETWLCFLYTGDNICLKGKDAE